MVARVLSKVVRLAFHNKNLLTFFNADPIALSGRHAKVRRDGYRSNAKVNATAG